MTNYEYGVDVPSLYATPPADEPKIRIEISAAGGGTVGKAYGHNGWEYAVLVNGEEILTESDLRSGMPATHATMAGRLAGFLGNAGESIAQYGNMIGPYAREYPAGPVRDLITGEYERLSAFSIDTENE